MKENSFKTLIITCWVVLFVCFIIKIFGGNWFELGTENTKFIQFCNFVDDNMWLKIILACIISILTSYPVYCLIYNKKRFKTNHSVVLIAIIVVRSILSWYLTWITFVIDALMLIILPIVLTRKWKRVLIVNAGAVILQLVSTFIRNVGVQITLNESFLIQALLQIDYIIMISLCYLYNIKHFIKREV